MRHCTRREKFFVGQATENLLGEGISPESLNEPFGQSVGQLYEAGLTQLFVTLATDAAKKFGVKKDSLYLDSSWFHIHGEYASKKNEETEQTGAIEITYGYSQDHQPDLKQIPSGLDVQWR